MKRFNLGFSLIRILIILVLTVTKAFCINSVDSLKMLLKQKNTMEQYIDINYQIAIAYSNEGSSKMSQYSGLVQGLARRFNYGKILGKVNYLIAKSNPENLSNDSIISLLIEAEKCFDAAEMFHEDALTLNNLGIQYERQGKYHSCLRSYYKALFIFQNLKDEVGIANEKNNIGLVHLLQHHYTNANYFFNQAITIGKRLKNQDILANSYNNMAISYQEQKEPMKALHFFEMVYNIDLEQKIPQNLALSYNNLGVIQTNIGNFYAAKDYLFKSYEIKIKLKDYNGLSNTLNNLAEVYLKTGKYDSAIYFLNLAIKNSKDENTYPILYDSYDLYSRILETKGDYANSLKYLRLYTELEDSINHTENQLLLGQMENDFTDLVNEKSKLFEASELESATLKENLYFQGLLFAILVIAFMLFYLFRGNKVNKSLRRNQARIETQNKVLNEKNLEISKARETAEEAVNVKSLFISTISHEIRTPLNAIVGVTNLLKEGNHMPEQLENLNILKISSDNLLKLVSNILDFSKLESGKIQLENIDFNIKQLVYDIKDLFSLNASVKGISLKLIFDENIPTVIKGDPLRLNQLFINLVNNAIKFSDSGTVEIRANMVSSSGDKVLIHFAVIDSGIGIPLEKQTEIFNSFVQVDSNTTRKFGGTGLGLSICKKILENLNSQLKLKSEVNKGSEFYFEIEFEISKNALSESGFQNEVFANLIKGKRILIAEDNLMNIAVIRQFLNKWGVDTEVAHNGKEAYEKFLLSDFDVILMDIHMPEMDGIEAARLIRSHSEVSKRNVPIIALTAENEQQLRQKVYDTGMTDYIFKPFSPDELLERLGAALSKG